MAGGSTTPYPIPPKSSSSTLQEDDLHNLKFGIFNPKSQISSSLDPVIQAAKVQKATTSVPFLERKYQEQRSEEVNLKEGLPVVSFDIGVKEQLISKINFVIVAKFSHGRPLFRDFHSFLSSLKFRGQFVISAFDRKHVFIDFATFDDFVKLWMMKSCVVKGFKARLFCWTDSFSPSVETSIAPVWVSLPGLPLYFLEEEALFSIGSALGKPLFIDPLNLSHRKVGAACICVALDVSKSLPEAIWIHFKGEGKVLEQILQRIVYHELPPFCKGCFHLGHNAESCKMGTGGRSNGGIEKGMEEEQVVLEKQIPDAFVLQGRQRLTRAKHLEAGEIEEVSVKEGSHLNEAKLSTVTGVSRVEGKLATDKEQKIGNPKINGDVKHLLIADVNPFTSLEGIKNEVDCANDLEQASKPAQEERQEVTDGTEEISRATESDSVIVKDVEEGEICTETDISAISAHATTSLVMHTLNMNVVNISEGKDTKEELTSISATTITNSDPRADATVKTDSEGTEFCLPASVRSEKSVDRCASPSILARGTNSTSTSISNKEDPAKIQEFIHTCEAVHIGRDMIEENKRVKCHNDTGVDIDQSALPYMKQMIGKRVTEEWNEKLNQVSQGNTIVLPVPTDSEAHTLSASSDDAGIKAQTFTHDGMEYTLQDITRQMATVTQTYKKSQAALDISCRDPEPVTPATLDLELLNKKTLQKLNLPLKLIEDNNYNFLVAKLTDNLSPEKGITDTFVANFAAAIATCIFPTEEEKANQAKAESWADIEEKGEEMDFSSSNPFAIKETEEEIKAPKRRGRPTKQKEDLPKNLPNQVPRKRGRPRKFT